MLSSYLLQPCERQICISVLGVDIQCFPDGGLGRLDIPGFTDYGSMHKPGFSVVRIKLDDLPVKRQC